MPIELITLIAALLLAWLLFTWLVRVVKTTISTAFAIAAIVLLLQVAFGIDPPVLWAEIQRFGQVLQGLFENISNGRSNAP
jgi:hypothetical protein